MIALTKNIVNVNISPQFIEFGRDVLANLWLIISDSIIIDVQAAIVFIF